MGDTTHDIAVPPDADTVDVLRTRIKSNIDGGGTSPAAALLAARFPAGVQLPGETGAARFSTDAAAGAPGWQPVDGWRQVVSATLLANTGDFALVRLADGKGAIGIHIGKENTLWILQVRPDADPSYRKLDPSGTTDLPAPACVALINYCGNVQLPVRFRGGGPGANECV